MAIITPQVIDLTGLVDFMLVAASAGGDVFINDGLTILVVNNAGSASIIVTVDSLKASSFGTDENAVITVGAGSRAFIGPFLRSRFNSASAQVSVAYDGVTSVTVAALALSERGW